MNSNEQSHSAGSERPLPDASSSDSRSKRNRKRRKPLKVPLIEKPTAGQTVETEIQQDEVRLIWDREPTNRPASEQKPETKEVPKPSTKKLEKAHTQKSVKKPVAETPAKPVDSVAEHTAPPEPRGAAVPADFQKLLNDLAKDRAEYDAELELAGQAHHEPAPEIAKPRTANHATPPSPDIEPPELPPALPPEASSYRHFFWNEPSIMSPAEARAERTALPTPETETRAAPASQPEKNPAPILEAVPLHDAREPQFPERMPGSARHVKAEATDQPEPQRSKQSAKSHETFPPVSTNERASLGFADLMKLAKKIKIDGVSLREIFIARRIDEEGLRALVQSYLRGGDVREQLTHEIINHEKSFERDPAERHKPAGQTGAAFARASVKVVQKSQDFGKAMQPAAREAGRMLKGAAQQARRELEGADISTHWIGIAAVAVIYILIIILLVV